MSSQTHSGSHIPNSAAPTETSEISEPVAETVETAQTVKTSDMADPSANSDKEFVFEKQMDDDTTVAVAAPPRAETFRKRRWINISQLNWNVVAGIIILHAGAIAAPFYFSWLGLAVFVFLFWVSGGLGITLCYHRLLTHRSFKTPKWVEYFLTGCACLAWQGGPVSWVGNHRAHHKHSDTDNDPHSPNDGFAWAHMFWCMHRDKPEWQDCAKDLQRDPIQRLFNRFFFVPNMLLAGALFGIGYTLREFGFATSGWSLALWGVCLRTVGVYHVTWFVNSATHVWGYRNFETKDRSTNLWWVALLSWGEGWHNNHHAFQRSAAHGLRWYEVDMTYLTIKLMEKLGLARDIVLPKPHQMPK